MNTNRESVVDTALIDFATVAVEFASMLEHANSYEPADFIDRCCKVLPLLYLKTTVLNSADYDPDEDYIEEYINEASYSRVQVSVENMLAANDSFLSSSNPEMPYSDTPLQTSIAECLADVYQQVGNLLGVLKAENELAIAPATGRCQYYFAEYWGERLLAALTALHNLRYGEAYLKLKDPDESESQAEEDYYPID